MINYIPLGQAAMDPENPRDARAPRFESLHVLASLFDQDAGPAHQAGGTLLPACRSERIDPAQNSRLYVKAIHPPDAVRWRSVFCCARNVLPPWARSHYARQTKIPACPRQSV